MYFATAQEVAVESESIAKSIAKTIFVSSCVASQICGWSKFGTKRITLAITFGCGKADEKSKNNSYT